MCEIIARIFYKISQAKVGWVLAQYKRDVCLANKNIAKGDLYFNLFVDSPYS